MTWRALLGLVLGGATAALGALILGEYEFTGTLPWVAGPLFGLVIGEVVAGALSFGGIAWAGWIDSTQGLEPVKGLVWVAASLAAMAAVLRTVRFRRR